MIPNSPPTDAEGWSFVEEPGGGTVTVHGRSLRTDYSRRIVELIVARKGVARMPRYLRYREERGAKLRPLFEALTREGRAVSVLEPGCSAGHLSEVILSYPCVTRLVSFDPDEGMTAVCREKKTHFSLSRWEIQTASSPEGIDERFDVVLMSAMMEHVDPRLRRPLIEKCYERLRPGGLLAVLESQNRWWPFEYHVIRLPLPYAQYLPARWLHSLLRVTGRHGPDWSLAEFANPNTGWWGTTYNELRTSSVSCTDVSETYGYGARRYIDEWATQGATGAAKRAAFAIVRVFAGLLGLPPAALLPALYVVFRKEG